MKKVKIKEITSKIKVLESAKQDSLEEEVQQEDTERFASFVSGKTSSPTLRDTGEVQEVREVDLSKSTNQPTAQRELYGSRSSYVASPNAATYVDPMAAAGARIQERTAPILRQNAIESNSNDLSARSLGPQEISNERQEDKRYISLEDQNEMKLKRRRDWRF